MLPTTDWSTTVDVPLSLVFGSPTGQTSIQSFTVSSGGTFSASDSFGNRFSIGSIGGLPPGTISSSLKSNSTAASQNFLDKIGNTIIGNVTVSYTIHRVLCQPVGVRITISGNVNWPVGYGVISLPFESKPNFPLVTRTAANISAPYSPTVAYFGPTSGTTLGLDWSDSLAQHPTYDTITNSVDYSVGDSFAIDPVTVATSSNSAPTTTDYQGHTCFASGRFWIFYNDGTHEGWVSSTDSKTWTTETTFATSGVQGGAFAFYCSGSSLYYLNPASTTGTGVYYRYGTLNSDGTISWSISEGEFTGTSTLLRGLSTVLDSNGGWWAAFGSQVDTLGIEVWHCSNPSSCSWSQNTNFATTNNGYVPYPQIVPLTGGKVAVTWTTGAGNLGTLSVKTYSGSQWSSQSSASGTYKMIASACASTPYGGDIVSCGVDSNNAAVGYISASYNGNSPTWSTFKSLASCSSSTDCYASISSGNVSLVLSFAKSTTTVGYFEASNVSASWSNEVDLSTSEVGPTAVSAPFNLGGSIQFTWTSCSSTSCPSPWNVRFANVTLGSLGQSWTGISYATVCGCTPSGTTGGGQSDVNLATGDGYIFEITNGVTNTGSIGEIWTATGTVKDSPFNLDQIFGTVQLAGDDAHIMYDGLSGRWFITAPSPADSNGDGKCTSLSSPCYIAIAVSKSSDPTSASNWYVYQVESSYCSSNYNFDDPVDGISSDKFAISAGVACSSGGNEYFILSVSQLISGPSGTALSVYDSGPTGMGNIAPVQSLTSGNTLYMVCNDCSSNVTSIYVFTVTGTPGGNPGVSVASNSVGVRTYSRTTPPAPQKGTSYTINVYDPIYQPKFFSGNIWLPFTEECTPPGDTSPRDCTRYIEVSTSTMKTLQDWDNAVAGEYFFDPVVTLDGRGNLYTEYAMSSSNNYVTLVYAGQPKSGAPNTLDWSSYIAFTSTGYIQANGNGIGDYFGIATDPLSSSRVWAAGEWVYYPSSGYPYWSTFIESFTIGGGNTGGGGGTLAIDGSQVSCGVKSTSCTTGTLTTTNADDVYIIYCFECTSTPTDSQSLPVTAYKSANGYLYEYYFTWTSSGSVTATCGGNVYTICAMFAISGASLSQIFDPNSSVPCTGTTNTCSISTSNANDVILGFCFSSYSSNNACDTAGSGYTALGATTPANTYTINAEYLFVSSTQSGKAVNWVGNGQAVIGEAIQ